MRVLALVPHPPAGASTRYRVHQFLPYLARRGVSVDVAPLLTEHAFERLYRPGRHAAKAMDWLVASVRRLSQVWEARRYDVVWIHREIWPLAGLLHESLLHRRNRRWLFDLDDAIYLPNVSQANRLFGPLKDASKSGWIASRASAISAGNESLRAWATRQTGDDSRAFLVPTAVDTDRWLSSGRLAGRPGDALTLGWIGSHSTLPYLEALRSTLEWLGRRHPHLRLLVVGAAFEVAGLRVECVPWTLDSEVRALDAADICLAPLPDTEWARGKCGLKVLQYMALAKPVISSPVGANLEIVRDLETGLFARSAEEWVGAVSGLVEDAALRRRLGNAGRARVEERYSVRSVEPRLFAALNRACEESTPCAG